MSLISNQLTAAGRLLAVVRLHLYKQSHAIVKMSGAPRKASVLLVMLAAAGSLLFVGAPKRQAHNGGLTIPESWRGTWEVTVAYRDHATGRLVASEVSTSAICPGEAIAPPLLNTLLKLTGVANDSHLNLTGRAKYAPRPGCNAFVNVNFESQRHGDIWHGTGSWTARVEGNCDHLNFGEDFVVTARRLSSEAACAGESLSLVERFFAHNALVPVLGRENER